MKTFGADPGTLKFGWAFLETDGADIISYACGVIKPKATHPIYMRCETIFHELAVLLEEYEPHDLAYESSYVGEHASAAIALGQAQGAMFAAASNQKLNISKYTPSEAKKAVTGYGNATKYEVQAQIAMLLGDPGIKIQEDAADALAVAVAHHKTLVESAMRTREIVGDPYRRTR